MTDNLPARTAPTKLCGGCRKSKALDSFGTNRAMADRLQRKCKECIRTQRHALAERHASMARPDRKICRSCHQDLNAAQFNVSRSASDGLQPMCKTCASAAHRLAKYGITADQYRDLLARQAGRCAICAVAECSSGRAFAVDHDHRCCPGKRTCGKCVRALLCWRCNHTLGVLGEDIQIFKSAIAYIETHQSR